MNKNWILLFSAIISLTAFSQKKELTLPDAVMQQYRGFYPTSLTLFQWVPQTDCYSYLEGYRTLMKANVKDNEAKKELTIQELNEKIDAELVWFSGFQWKDANSFWVNDGKNFYTYNLVDEKGEKIHELSDEAENPTFNEKKQNLAYTVKNNLYISLLNGTKLSVTENEDKNIVSGQAIARSEFGITNGLFWSNGGQQLAFYQKDETHVTDYPLLDHNETPAQLKSIKYPMAGQKSERAKVGIYSIDTKKTHFIQPLHGEENYLTNLSWSKNDKFIFIAEVNRDQNQMWLHKFDASNGQFVKTVLEEKNEKWIEPEHPAFFPTEKSFVWISEKDGFNNLYLYTMEGVLLKKLTEHKFVVKNIVGERNGVIYYTATGENPTETHLYSVDLKGHSKKITSTDGTHNVEISSNGAYIFDHFSSRSTPAKDQVLNKKGKVVKVLNKGVTALDNYTIGTAEIGTIKANDGTDLYTRLIKPSDFDPKKKYPVLVYVYGGPHAQMITNSWLDGASLWMYWMAEQGYLVFTVDNRGSASRGFAFESQIHRQLGTVEMEDQMAGVKYLKSLPYVDGDRLAVHGWSFGGFMTTSLMLREPGKFQVGVAGGPVTDWKYYEIMYGERYMDRPEENPEGYKQSSLMTYADKLEGDLLLIHGTSDDVVVMQHNFALIQKFVEEGVQVDFFPYPMHKHNVRGKDRVHLIEKILNYVIEKNQ